MDESMNELLTLKASIEEARKGQFQARKEFAAKLVNLGYSLYNLYNFPHPSEEGKTVYIQIQNGMGNLENTFNGYFHVEVHWPISCVEYGCEDPDCDGGHVDSRPATAEEVIAVLKEDLMGKMEVEWREKERCDSLAASLPSEQELAKIRHKVEDVIRKDKGKILPFAKLLNII